MTLGNGPSTFEADASAYKCPGAALTVSADELKKSTWTKNQFTVVVKKVDEWATVSGATKS